VIGKVIAGRFELEREAGAGGMGTVYRARDLTDGAAVAVKILTGREIRETARFELEASILAGLTHAAIVRHIAHGVTDKGERYIVMEWLDGEDLGTRLGRRPLTVVESVALARRAAEALAHAHGLGVVHRDVKPENLFLPGRAISRLKVLDFGIARLTRGGRKLTLTGSLIGTPGYMAPEVVRGERDVTARADVFSLGCVLFQCLTGRVVFEAEEATALLAKILLQDAPRVKELAPHLPDALDDIIARMLAKDPARRLADARQVLDELGALGDLEAGSGGSGARHPRPALTASEQRISCVVIAGPSPAEPSSDGDAPRLSRETTQPGGGRQAEMEGLGDELARAHGGRLQPLPDGSLVLTMPDVGKATDQAARAARCALALQAALPEVPLVLSMGPARVSAWAVVGEVIDSGMRLLRGTPPGCIRLDDMAAGFLGARFEIRQDGTASYLRGERDLYEVRHNLLGKATAFVGRGREISMLTNLYASCAAEAMGSAVLVVGAAGVGKSRLRQELVDWVLRQRPRCEVLFGAGDSLGAGSPFAMLGRAIRRAAGIQEAEPLEDRRRKLAARLGRHVEREALPRVAAFVGEIANVPFPDAHNEALQMARSNPQLMGDAMRRSWEDWLCAECAAHPVLLVLEDLQWGDLGTVSFVDAALRNLREAPFMVVGVARPDVEARFPELWRGRELQVIRLGPLSRRAGEQLVREALGGGVPEAAVRQILERADGNAFYLEELIRAAAAGRREELPDSVIGMVQARLDAEGAEAKRVLRAAAVFGERFSRAGVAALLGGDGTLGDVGQWLEHLVARELCERAPSADRRADAELTFTHALVREAAYAMLTDEDRVLGHRLAGDWLEQSGAGDAMALAEHFRRGEEPARALRWYELAAAQALKADDLGAAIERAELGMECGAGGETAGALRLIQAEGHVWLGELEAAERRALEAAAALLPGSAAWLRAQGQAVAAAAKRGKLDLVEQQARLVAETPLEAGSQQARSCQIVCLASAANHLISGGRQAAADALMTLVGSRMGGLADTDLQALALLHQVRAARAAAAGDLGSCLGRLEAALQTFEQAGDLRNSCAARATLGAVCCELGDLERAEAALRNALAAADRMGLRDLTAVVLHNLGRVLGLRGELAEARRLEARAVESFAAQGDARLGAVARTYLAEILVAAGEHEAAEREALAAAEALGAAPALRVPALGMVARARLGRRDAAGALAAAREAHAALEALGQIEPGEAAVRLCFAEALALTGAVAEARAALGVARERLLARAARIEEPGWRRRFLHDVPANARLLALADEWLPP
jgi:predicted ATPase